MIRSLPLFILLATAGCGAAADGSLEPGNWEQKMTIRAVTVPGAPAAVQQAAQAMVGKEQKQESCMSAAEAALGIQNMAQQLQDGQCTASDFTAEGGKMAGKVACKTGATGSANMTITGNYTRTTLDMNAATEVADASVPGGRMQMQMEIKARHLGACTNPAS